MKVATIYLYVVEKVGVARWWGTIDTIVSIICLTWSVALVGVTTYTICLYWKYITRSNKSTSYWGICTFHKTRRWDGESFLFYYSTSTYLIILVKYEASLLSTLRFKLDSFSKFLLSCFLVNTWKYSAVEKIFFTLKKYIWHFIKNLLPHSSGWFIVHYVESLIWNLFKYQAIMLSKVIWYLKLDGFMRKKLHTAGNGIEILKIVSSM